MFYNYLPLYSLYFKFEFLQLSPLFAFRQSSVDRLHQVGECSQEHHLRVWRQPQTHEECHVQDWSVRLWWTTSIKLSLLRFLCNLLRFLSYNFSFNAGLVFFHLFKDWLVGLWCVEDPGKCYFILKLESPNHHRSSKHATQILFWFKLVFFF